MVRQIRPKRINANYHWYLLENIGYSLVESKVGGALSKKIKEKEYLIKKNNILTHSERLTIRKILNRVLAVKIKTITKVATQKNKKNVRFYLQIRNRKQRIANNRLSPTENLIPQKTWIYLLKLLHCSGKIEINLLKKQYEFWDCFKKIKTKNIRLSLKLRTGVLLHGLNRLFRLLKLLNKKINKLQKSHKLWGLFSPLEKRLRSLGFWEVLKTKRKKEPSFVNLVGKLRKEEQIQRVILLLNKNIKIIVKYTLTTNWKREQKVIGYCENCIGYIKIL